MVPESRVVREGPRSPGDRDLGHVCLASAARPAHARARGRLGRAGTLGRVGELDARAPGGLGSSRPWRLLLPRQGGAQGDQVVAASEDGEVFSGHGAIWTRGGIP